MFRTGWLWHDALQQTRQQGIQVVHPSQGSEFVLLSFPYLLLLHILKCFYPQIGCIQPDYQIRKKKPGYGYVPCPGDFFVYMFTEVPLCEPPLIIDDLNSDMSFIKRSYGRTTKNNNQHRRFELQYILFGKDIDFPFVQK